MKHFGFFEFIRQRFLYSRYYAGNCFGPGGRAKRLVAFLLTPLLPAVLLWRFHRQSIVRPGYLRNFVGLLPLLFPFALVWTLGEMTGYAFGPGNALARLE